MIQFIFHYVLFHTFCIILWYFYLRIVSLPASVSVCILTFQDYMAADVLSYNKQITWITSLVLLCWFLVLESEHLKKNLLWFSTKSIQTCRFETWWWVNDEHWVNIAFNSCFNLKLSCTWSWQTAVCIVCVSVDCDGIIRYLLKTHGSQTGAPARCIDCFWLIRLV